MNKTHIEIEKMLFGDYRVQVWDETLDSLLDREYFCRGYASALMTAIEIRTLPNFEMLDIWYRNAQGELILANKANQAVSEEEKNDC